MKDLRLDHPLLLGSSSRSNNNYAIIELKSEYKSELIKVIHLFNFKEDKENDKKRIIRGSLVELYTEKEIIKNIQKIDNIYQVKFESTFFGLLSKSFFSKKYSISKICNSRYYEHFIYIDEIVRNYIIEIHIHSYGKGYRYEKIDFPTEKGLSYEYTLKKEIKKYNKIPDYKDMSLLMNASNKKAAKIYDMGKKILYLDTETTGLNAEKNDIIQISGLIEIDGKVVKEFDFKCRPFNPKNIEEEALLIQGRTREEIMKYPDPKEVFFELIEIFDGFIDKYNTKDKFILAGQNVRFDYNFLYYLAQKMEYKYLNSYINNNYNTYIDLLRIIKEQKKHFISRLKLPNLKLGTIYKALFDKDLDNAHNSLVDIKATRKCIKILEQMKIDDKGMN